jgi:2-aminoadipate transaminase
MVVENPTYIGMLMASRPFQADYIPIPTDEDGVMVDELPALLEQNPKMVYMVPNFQNPQGVTLSAERRKQLVAMTYDKPLVLIEDNPYGELRYSGDTLPTLLALDAQQRGSRELDGNVVYIGTFSKTLTPGLRVGWVVANETIIDKLVQVKQSADLHTSTFTQFVAYEVAKDGFLDDHITTLREVYRERRDVMLAAMAEHFPEGVTWQKPIGGLFLMVYMPPQIDAVKLLEKAVAQKVAFVPGGDFHIDGTGQNTFRLNYSNAKPDAIREGIKRLGTLIKAELAEK